MNNEAKAAKMRAISYRNNAKYAREQEAWHTKSAAIWKEAAEAAEAAANQWEKYAEDQRSGA